MLILQMGLAAATNGNFSFMLFCNVFYAKYNEILLAV